MTTSLDCRVASSILKTDPDAPGSTEGVKMMDTQTKATEIAAQIARELTPAQVAANWLTRIEGGEYYNRPSTSMTARKALSRQAKERGRLTEDADAWAEGLALAGKVIADPLNRHTGSRGGIEVAAMILDAMNVTTMTTTASELRPGGLTTYVVKAVR